MLPRCLFVFGLAPLVTGWVLPTARSVYGSESELTESPTDQLGIVKRGTAITEELHKRLIYWSEWATAAYCEVQQKGVGKLSCQPAKVCGRVEASQTKLYKSWNDVGNNSATGFVAADHTNKKIVISMRGSVSLNNWLADLKFFQTACPQFGGAKALCNVGFFGFWEQSKPAAMIGLEMGLKENPTYDIVLTGHSLGAAAAVYGAGELRVAPKYKGKKVELYSYGQPRAGNDVMSKYVTAQGNNYRVTHTSDIVPKLPPEYSPLSFLSGDYVHISPEYWIEDGVGMKIQNIKVVEGLSNGAGNSGTGFMKFNIVAHVQYFQTNMYYCVLPLPDLLGYAAGTKYRDMAEFPDWPATPAEYRITPIGLERVA